MEARRSNQLQRLAWSDVPFVLSVCEAGSLAAAARRLGVNHSTVFRRIEAVEAKLGLRLFERQSHGYVMTPAGELFLRHAGALRDGMNQIELELTGEDLRLEGPLTITMTDTLLHCLAPVLAEFQADHPDVELRLVSDARALDLMQRDADVALRPTPKPPEHWVGRKLWPIICAVYAHESYWNAARTLAPEARRWIALNEELDRSPMSLVEKLHRPTEASTTFCNTAMGVFDMVRSGLGVAALPCYLGDPEPGLLRVAAPSALGDWNLWLLAHPDVRRSARVHAFFDHASHAIGRVAFGNPGSDAPEPADQ